MALSEDDLKFFLELVPDTTAVDKAFADIAKDMDLQANAQKAVTDQLQTQLQTLANIKALGTPEAVEKQVALERQITAAKKEQAALMEKERKAQRTPTEIGKHIAQAFMQGGFKGAGKSLGSSGLLEAVGIGGGGGAAAGAGAAGGGALASIGAMAAPIAAVGAAAVVAGAAVWKFVGFIMDIPGKLQAWVAPLANLTKVANPAQYERLQIILTDVAGTVGRSLSPVLEALLPAFRMVGDVLATILPTASQMAQIMKPISEAFDALRKSFTEFFSSTAGKAFIDGLRESFAALAEILKPVIEFIGQLARVIMSVLGPVFKLLASILGFLAPVLQFVVDLLEPIVQLFELLGSVLSPIIDLINLVVKGFGWLMDKLSGLMKFLNKFNPVSWIKKGWDWLTGSGEKKDLSSSTGAAARQANITDLSSYANQLATSAFSAGAYSPAERAARSLASINDFLRNDLRGMGLTEAQINEAMTRNRNRTAEAANNNQTRLQAVEGWSF